MAYEIHNVAEGNIIHASTTVGQIMDAMDQ